MCEWSASSAGSPRCSRRSLALRLRRRHGRTQHGRTKNRPHRSPAARVIRDTYHDLQRRRLSRPDQRSLSSGRESLGLKVLIAQQTRPPPLAFSEPSACRRHGDQARVQLRHYVDPKTGDVYSVTTDTVDHMVVFPRDAKGNVRTMRGFAPPHGTFGIAVDEVKQEMSITVQHDHAVVTTRRTPRTSTIHPPAPGRPHPLGPTRTASRLTPRTSCCLSPITAPVTRRRRTPRRYACPLAQKPRHRGGPPAPAPLLRPRSRSTPCRQRRHPPHSRHPGPPRPCSMARHALHR